jgi:hypothetical protein
MSEGKMLTRPHSIQWVPTFAWVSTFAPWQQSLQGARIFVTRDVLILGVHVSFHVS